MIVKHLPGLAAAYKGCKIDPNYDCKIYKFN